MGEPNSVRRRASKARVRHRNVLLLLLFFGGWPLAASADVPTLHTDTTVATAGYYRLTWDWPQSDNRRFELQEAQNADFTAPRTLYQGPDRASLLSGRTDGQYYYRVRLNPENGQPGPWSDSVQIAVEHHSLGRAWTFFGVGAGVFLATLGLVVGGNLKSNHKGNG